MPKAKKKTRGTEPRSDIVDQVDEEGGSCASEEALERRRLEFVYRKNRIDQLSEKCASKVRRTTPTIKTVKIHQVTKHFVDTITDVRREIWHLTTEEMKASKGISDKLLDLQTLAKDRKGLDETKVRERAVTLVNNREAQKKERIAIVDQLLRARIRFYYLVNALFSIMSAQKQKDIALQGSNIKEELHKAQIDIDELTTEKK